MSVIGTLVSRSGYLDATSGLASYVEIGEAIAGAMSDPTVRGVVLDVDSAGGKVGGLFDLVEHIRAMTAASGKPLWAVANESALSAAYAIASATDRVYVTRTGVDATGGDKTGLVVARGPAIVSKAALVFDASVDQAAEKTAKHAQLAGAGIVPRETA